MTNNYTMDFTPSTTVLQAKLQAWCVNLLSILVDAYELGAVLGKGACLRTEAGDALYPDIMFVPTSAREAVRADAVHATTGAAPTLAIDFIHSDMPDAEHAALRQRYAAARILEYWQVEADKARPLFYQASAAWTYDMIPPDKAGMHFSVAIVELSFPVVWFRRQPGLWSMMQYWGMIHE